VLDGLYARGRIGVVKTVRVADRNVDDVHARLLDCFAEAVEIAFVGGREVRAERLDAGDLKPLAHLSGKILQVDAGLSFVAILVGRTLDFGTKRPSRDGEAFARNCWKFEVRFVLKSRCAYKIPCSQVWNEGRSSADGCRTQQASTRELFHPASLKVGVSGET
jgi:hypothetical protein